MADGSIGGSLLDIVPNDTLGRVMHRNLTRVATIDHVPAERAFADSMSRPWA